MTNTRILLTLGLVTLLLASCSPPATPAPTLDMNAAMTQAFATVNAAGTATALASLPTETPIPSATPTRSGPPPELPPILQVPLEAGVASKTYLTDACQYLRAKWDPNNAAPGTIVMVIMFHSIEKGTQTAANPMHVGSGDFKRLMKTLHDFGFQAINANQLADFLDSNAKIPARSVVLIQDDRHAAENYNDWFRPYWEEWGWPVINAWISWDDSIRNQILQDNIALGNEGLVDFQSHGYVHNTPMTDSSPDDYIRSEFENSKNDLQTNFGKTPVAIIWPGGGFGLRPVQIAREFGYRVGFTVNPRGPIMFNWVPQADVATGSFDIAEGPVGDPRMTLPRYWPNQVIPNLDTVRLISEQAAAYAQQTKATELEYYDIVCAPTLGPIPAAVP